MKTQFPRQKLKSTSKGPAWAKKHPDWAEHIFTMDDSPIRETLKNRTENYNLYLGKTSKTGFEMILNPGELSDTFMPDNIQHYPIAKPYLNVLIGEEAERRFEWRAVLTNPDAISKIEEDKANMLRQKIQELVTDQSIDDRDAQEKLQKYMRFLRYDYQDVRERMCNLLLKHFIKELDLKLKFNQGFKDVMLAGEEGYIGDIINHRPVIDVIDPKKIFVVRSGYSNRYEDADVLIMYDYWSPGKIVDRYYTSLKTKDVKWLDEAPAKKYGASGDDQLARDEFGVNLARKKMVEDFLELPGTQKSQASEDHSEVIDKYGNVRVIRVFWKSYKPIIRVKYYDQLGDVQYRFESEHYVADKASGEETQEYWVSEWWEAVKAGEDIYPVLRPRKIQYNKFKDPGYNHPGIVGQIYNTGNMRVVSYMDTAKPYQYLYDATMHRLQDALSKFFGSLVTVDYASLPEGWDVSKWMFFAKKAGIAVKDSFKEGNKGAATGKLAASMTGNTGQVINQQLGDFIQQQINILNYVEMQMGRIIGVPPQRLGEISNRETVGGVERAVTQSSFITNETYKIHDNVKKRVLTMLLELAKLAMKGNPEKFQHIGDDYTQQLFEIDEDMLEEEYGILVDNDNDLTKLEQNMETLAQAAMQNQVLKFSDLLKLYNSSSMADKQQIIEQGEEDMMKRQEDAQKRQEEMQQQQMQMAQAEAQRKEQIELQKHQDDLKLKKYEIDSKHITEKMKLSHSELVSDQDAEVANKELDRKYEEMEKKLLAEMKDIDERIRSNKASEKIKLKEITVKKQQQTSKSDTSK